MLNAPEPACLVIADISGYTSYLAGVELDHAQDILGDLMNTVVGSLRPAFRLAKLEGDAAFCYVMTDTVDGSALMDSVEGTYFAFRRRLRDVAAASTCECNACIRIPSLNLKVLAHHGPVGRQRIAGRDELVGSEVILAHRLLKNEVTEGSGMVAYALYTDACVRAMGIDPEAVGLVEHRETYEVIGEVICWLRDLEAAWTDELDRTRVVVEPGDAFASFTFDLPAPPGIVWEYVTSPARRPRWQHGVTEIVESSTSGRRGVGTTNHCMHGKDAIIEEIVDWRPTDYLTLRWQLPMPGAPKMLMTELFEPAPLGTAVTYRFGRPRSKKEQAFLEQVLPGLEPAFRAGVDALGPLVAEEAERRAEDSPVETTGSRSS